MKADEFVLIEPDIEAGGAERFDDPQRRHGVLRRVAEEEGSCGHRRRSGHRSRKLVASGRQAQDFVDFAADRAAAGGGYASNNFVNAVAGDNVKKFTAAHTGKIEAVGSVEQDLVMLGSFGRHALGTSENVEAELAIIGAPLGGGDHHAGVKVAIRGIDPEANDIPLLNFHRAA